MEEWHSLLQPANIEAFLHFMKGDADDGNINTPRNPSKKRSWLLYQALRHLEYTVHYYIPLIL
jgi:hypothetical protein